MRILLLLTFLSLLSCESAPIVPENQGCLEEGDTYHLPDGTALNIVQVREFFCPCNANCIPSPPVRATFAYGSDTLELSGPFDLSDQDGFLPQFAPPFSVDYRGYIISIANFGFEQGKQTCDSSGRYDHCVELRVNQRSTP